MCGIAGLVNASGASLELVAQMTDAVRHRGPDDEGYVAVGADGTLVAFRGDDTPAELGALPHWREGDPGRCRAVLGHRRLAILDLSVSAHGPMVSADGELVLSFNGEIYNYLELRAELTALGRPPAGPGDTAALLAAFAEWGPACVERLRGMWAFAVYDRRTRTLTLSRDRFGIKPLYYHRSPAGFVFASEIKALLPLLGPEPRGSMGDVLSLLSSGTTGDDVTFLQGVDSLAPGTTLQVGDEPGARPRLHRYYVPGAGASSEFEGTLDEAVDGYRRRLDESVRLHMRSDVQVGSCLSGGLDSNLVVALATERPDVSSMATFTAVYDDPAFDEREYVEQHAARSAAFRSAFVEPDADHLLAVMDDLVWAQELPLRSASPYAQWCVMELARQHDVKVLLDGQGADEAIGGYAHFAGTHVLDLLRGGHAIEAARAARVIPARRSVDLPREVARAAYLQAPPMLQRQARRFARGGHGLVAPRYRARVEWPQPRRLRSYRDHCIDSLQRGLPELLRYEDRSSMAFSIEARVPFLDHPLVEFVLALPNEFKFHDGWSKFVQRKASENVLPDSIVWRRDKLGFATPQRAWKQALLGPLREFIVQADVPPFIDRQKLVGMLDADLATAVSASEFWQTVFLLKWMQLYRVRFDA
jgi:asparagine synthase (glutamine-hydrolysing)